MPIPAAVLGGLVAGGGALLGGGLNWLGQRDANRTNVRLAKMGQKFELDMWNKQNAYNSPTEQMQRLIDAGLNPNLMYGSGANSGLSSSMPRAHVPTVSNELQGFSQPLSNALNMYMDFRMKDAQVNAINNNADLTLQKTINEAYRKQLMTSQINRSNFEVSKGKTLLPWMTDMYEANIAKTRSANQDMLWKLQQRNPAEIASMLLKNRDLAFKTNVINPKIARDYNMRYNLGRQQYESMNPSLLELRMMQRNMQQLDYDFEKGLRPYNVTGKDNILYRLLPNIFNDKPERKDVLFRWK